MNAPRILLPILLATAFQANTVEAEERAKTVATIVDARGKCYVRSGEAGPSQPLQSGVKLSAGQEVLCDLGGSLKIRFEVTSDERPIVPRWTKIGNVPPPLDPSLPIRGQSRTAKFDQGNESNPNARQPAAEAMVNARPATAATAARAARAERAERETVRGENKLWKKE